MSEYNYGPIEHELAGGQSIDRPLCEYHNKPICIECGYCELDVEHLRHIRNEPPAPRAGERYNFVIFTGRYKILDYYKPDGQQIATADGKEEARTIVRALNAAEQHTTLVEQRDRLLQIARDALSFRIEMNGSCNHDNYMIKLCSQCEIRYLLTTIEQSGKNAGEESQK